MASEDGFSDSIWPVFTAEDLEEIDKICESQEIQGGGQDSGTDQPQIEIEVEVPADDSLSKPVVKGNKSERKSLYDSFRIYGGFLSVTDCVAPSWCEVQYDYGLRQRRSMPLESRPTSFKTEKGKEIKVELKAAEKREKIMTAGTAVHKVLEKEQKLEDIQIRANTQEEIWALRLLDFLTRMKILEQDSYCDQTRPYYRFQREIGVWGIVQDQIIFGCIDELRLDADPDKKETRKSSPSKKAKAQKSDPKQRTLQDMVHPSASHQALPATPVPEPNHDKVIRIIDTKTRSINTVPTHVDTLSSRLQLMLYRHLLVGVITADPVMFLDLWERLGCDVGLAFSAHFKADMNLMVASNELHLSLLDAGCLLDMLEPMQESMERFPTQKVAESLSLVYRRRNAPRRHKARKPENGSKEMEFCDKKDTAESSSMAATRTDGNSPSRKRKHEELCNGDANSGTTTQQAAANAKEDEGKNAPAKVRDVELIGTKKFKFNSQMLEEHMTSILRWWYGKRPSEGVSVENTHRCRSCEYRGGCEWRETKARELGSKKA